MQVRFALGVGCLFDGGAMHGEEAVVIVRRSPQLRGQFFRPRHVLLWLALSLLQLTLVGMGMCYEEDAHHSLRQHAHQALHHTVHVHIRAPVQREPRSFHKAMHYEL